jgi:WD40 repeat protein
VAGGPSIAALRGQRARVFDVDFGAESDRVASAGDDGTVRFWHVGRALSWSLPGIVDGIAFNRDGRLIASSSEDGAVRVWDAATGRLRATLPGPAGYTAAKFSPASDTLVVPSHGGSMVRIWPLSAESAEVVVRLPKNRSVYSARFDGTGERIVVVDTAGSVVVHDLGSGREQALRGTREIFYDAQFSPAAEQVAAVAESGKVTVWRLDRPGRPERVLEGHRGHLNGLAYSRDGRIATAGADRTVRVWSPAGGRPVVLDGHKDEVTSVVFTGDGARVLSTSFDGTLRLWDARTGAALGVLRSGAGDLYDVLLSRDGNVATLGEDDSVRIFPCDVCGSLDEVRRLALSRSPRPLAAEERRRFLVAD